MSCSIGTTLLKQKLQIKQEVKTAILMKQRVTIDSRVTVMNRITSGLYKLQFVDQITKVTEETVYTF